MPTPVDNSHVILSGEWKSALQLSGYRAEFLGDMLVERAAWKSGAPQRTLAQVQVAGPGYIWVRFWLLEREQVVEKYFDPYGKVVGYFVPICMPFDRTRKPLAAVGLLLGLWLDQGGRLTVLDEDLFEQAVRRGQLSALEAETAELRIRELTGEIAQRRFPPGLVRNFLLDLGRHYR